ncbi:sodium-coupled monocarboxylate transporter 1-like [Tropilaelaps mercedesae]|uniref:Sodium-coupled monocarboxylate transporter 1-like n=1 Tax=Tropilaelaps mercedesae TaxID=418985 RepID=A0A1V9XFW6_9ACAR|nr:sodium-coupled monocarboxylate transporter 1-like [Tropilaelaps mercedesae]
MREAEVESNTVEAHMTKASSFFKRTPSTWRWGPTTFTSFSCFSVQAAEQDSLCGACGQLILERIQLRVNDVSWHVDCLRCCTCDCLLEKFSTCFFRDGNVYCKQDYARLAFASPFPNLSPAASDGRSKQKGGGTARAHRVHSRGRAPLLRGAKGCESSASLRLGLT